MLNHQTTPKKEEKKQDPAKERKTQCGPGSPSGTTPTPKPQIQGKIVVQVTGKKTEKKEDEGDDNEEEDEEEDGDENEDEDDIAELEKLEKAASTKKPQPKGAGTKRKGLKPKRAQKKKAKGSNN